MGLRYSFELTWNATDVMKALRALSARLVDHGHQAQVHWADAQVSLYCFSRDPITLGPGNGCGLLVSIWLPEDPAHRNLIATYEKRLRTGPETFPDMEVAIGFVELDISIGHRFCRLSFKATTSDMSRYFECSPHVSRWFLEFGHRTGGLEILFDDETDDAFVDLNGGARRIPRSLG